MLLLLQWYFRAVSRLLPGFSGRLATRLFLTPQRYPVQSDAGRELLATAQREALVGISGPVCVRRWPNAGPRVLLVHGWSDRAANLGDVIRRLLDAGYDVTAPDLPAHGDSTGRWTHMREWQTALRQLSVRAGGWYAVIGHSLGGFAVATSVRDDLPQYGPSVKTERLVLIAPPDDSMGIMNIFGDILNIPATIRARAVQELSRIIEADFADFSTAQALAGFAGDALVFHDRDDRRVPFSHFESIRRAVPAQQFLVTEGLGHRRILSDARILDRISEFLDDGALASRSATGRSVTG